MARISLVVDQETFDATNTDFSPVPEGEYLATIFAVEAREVQNGDNKGKTRLNVQYRITDGETAPDGTKQGNRRVFQGVNAFYGKSRKDGSDVLPFDLVGIIKALGGNAESLADMDTDDWLGEALYIKVVHEERMTKESGYKEPFVPAQYRENVRSVRSMSAATTAATSTATVTGGKKTYVL